MRRVKEVEQVDKGTVSIGTVGTVVVGRVIAGGHVVCILDGGQEADDPSQDQPQRYAGDGKGQVGDELGLDRPPKVIAELGFLRRRVHDGSL